MFSLLVPSLREFGWSIVQPWRLCKGKLKSLEDAHAGQLAGKMGIVIDLMSRLPVEIWFLENPRASDPKLESNILNLVEANTLLLLDRGF